MNKNIIFSLILTLMLIMSASSIFAGDKDLILSAKYDVQLFNSSDSYLKKDLVLFNNEIYEIQDEFNNLGSTPLTDPELFTILTDKETQKITDKNKLKEIKIKDGTIYNGYSAIKGKYKGDEVYILDEKLIALDHYQPQDFEVTLYVGTDNVKYGIYHYDGITDNHTLVRQNRDLLFYVYSKNGFITYTTNDFSTQIASVPDQIMTKNEIRYLPFKTWFAVYDNTFASVSDVPVGWGVGYGEDIYWQEEKNYTSPDLDISVIPATTGGSSPYPFIIGDEVVKIESYNDVVPSFELNFCVWSDVGEYFCYTGDTALVEVVGSVSQTASINNVQLTDDNGISIYMGDHFADFETININYTDGTLQQLTQSIGDSVADTNFNNVDVTLDYNNNDIELFIAGNSLAYGPNTFDVCAKGYDGSFVCDSFTVEVTVSAGGGSGGNLETGALLYWSMDNNDLYGSDIQDLVGSNHGDTNQVTTGVTGVINESFSFTSGSVSYIKSNLTVTAGTDWSMSIWFKKDSANAGMIWSAAEHGYDYIYMNADTTIQVATSNVALSSAEYDDYTFSSLGTTTWHHLVYTVESDTAKLYIDNDLKGTQTLSTGFGALGTQTIYVGKYLTNGLPFDGDLDEFVMFDYAINTTEIDFLYNSGTPTTDQVYPFTQPDTTPPSLTSAVPDYNIRVNTFETFNFNSYFANATDYYVYVAGQNLSVSETYNATDYFIEMNNNLVTITAYNNFTSVNVNYSACNSNGCVSDIGTISGFGAFKPLFAGSQVYYELYENDSETYPLHFYFSDYDDIYVSFNDPVNATLFNLTTNTESNNTYYKIELSLFDSLLIQTNTGYSGDLINESLDVLACNSFGCNEQDDLIVFSVLQNPTTPPTQTASLSNVEYTIGTNYTYDYKTFFTNATNYNITFYNPATSTNYSLALGQTIDAISFEITRQVDNTLYIKPYLELSNNPIYVQTCNVNGCLNYTSFLMSIVEAPVTPTPTTPQDVDSIFDDIFAGSTKLKLVGAVVLILVLFVWMKKETESQLGGILGAVGGVILSVVFGLISVELLIILFVLLGLIAWIMAKSDR